ncbi:hypothetical protein EfmJHP10_19230 [Enterococcus faecium]|nr:hypothetical protein EfmJHP10_19230 [Enterococcus faecium]
MIGVEIKVSSDVKDELKSIFKASELELTRERKEHFLEKYGCDSKLSAACDILENGFEDAIWNHYCCNYYTTVFSVWREEKK